MSFADNTVELPQRNFLSPQFGTKFQKKVPNFLTVQCVGYVEGSVRAKYQLDSSGHFDTIPACDGQTDGHTMTANTTLA